ncbi:MAG: TolC family protein [Gammaproteobacteria bacterium]|nr:TolC family protein [Gammaproteobacteria bacterium]
MNERIVNLAAAALLLAGCSAVGPDYAEPEQTTADAVGAWPSATAAGEAVSTGAPPEAWWRELGDTTLDRLVELAIAANYDLRVAVANVEAARAALRGVETRRRPRVDLNATVQERRDASGLLILADPHQRFPTTSSGTFSADLGWEIDIFGRVRRSIEAAVADLGSAQAVRDAVITAVLAEVARNYVALRGAQTRLSVAQHNVDVQRQTMDLVGLLLQEGAATDLDMARARTQLLTSEATIPRLRASARAAANRLTTLTGQAPGALDAELAAPAPLPPLPAMVAVGAPLDLLRRRADIRAAERAIAAAAARIGIATADLYPTVSFGARVGVGGTPLSSLTSAGGPFFSLGPALTWNLFDRKGIYARIAQQDSAAAAGVARFEAAVTGALEEVDTALRSWLDERERRARLEQARSASRDATRLARLRYREGVEDFLTVLDAERRLLEVEDQLAASEIALAENLVEIYRALGGGWETATPPEYVPYAP